jgi:hypothetical protein
MSAMPCVGEAAASHASGAKGLEGSKQMVDGANFFSLASIGGLL